MNDELVFPPSVGLTFEARLGPAVHGSNLLGFLSFLGSVDGGASGPGRLGARMFQWVKGLFRPFSWALFAFAVVFLGACATATTKPVVPRAIAPPAPRQKPPAPSEVLRLLGWSDSDAVLLASSRWALLDAFVVERRKPAEKEIVLALVRGEELVGSLPLARVPSTAARPRSVVAGLAELPLGTDLALRADLTTYEGGNAQLFAVKMTLVAVSGERPQRILDRLVESGDRVRDRRAIVTVKDVDGDGTPELVVEERETGVSPPRTVTYRRDREGRFVTRDASIFDAP